MSEFSDALDYAAKIAPGDPDAYISSVKNAVRSEFERIDRTADLEDTLYFNHSAVPDFVMHWPDGSDRRLYLRDSYEAIVAGEDPRRFNSSRPMLLAIKPPSRGDRDHRDTLTIELEDQARSAPETLIIDTETLDSVAEPSAIPTTTSPVSDLIRTNLPRGGRGLLTSERVASLLAIGASQPAEGDIGHYQQQLAESFLPESAERITRTATLIGYALSGQLPSADSPRQNLDAGEISMLLPWLLTNPNTTRNLEFWRYIGAMMRFSDLFRVDEFLQNVDLSPLVTANLTEWTGRRAYIGLESIPSENASEAEERVREDGTWALIGSTIGVNFNGSRLHLAPSGSAIRGRGGESAVLWAHLTQTLGGFKVSSVTLKGVSRSIAISAEESPDVSEDVERIADSVDDRYYVKRLRLSFPAPGADDDSADVEVNFDSSIISADSAIHLADLASAAIRVLRYNDPVDEFVITEVIGMPAPDTRV